MFVLLVSIMEDYLSAEDHILPVHTVLTRNCQFVILSSTNKDREILLTLEGLREEGGVEVFRRGFTLWC